MAQSYSGGDGTSGNPYQIANKTDLKYLSEHSGEWSKHFIQTADITFTDTDFQSGGDFYNGGAGFIPIGNNSTIFTGSYDGGGHTMDGLFINRPTTDNIGLFGVSDNATFSNIDLINVNITGNNSTGSIAGKAEHLIMNYCYSTGSVTGYDLVGGMIGYSFYNNYQNQNSTSTNSISDNYSKCTVTGHHCVGGFIGWASHSNPVNKCYATGSVTASGDGYGGLIGCSDSYVNNSFWDTETSGPSSNGSGPNYGTGKTTAEMKTQSTFDPPWDFTASGDWAINSYINDGYPYLQSQSGGAAGLWTGTDTDWNTATNWDDGNLPTLVIDVVIPSGGNQPVIGSGTGASCNKLTVNSGATLTVESGGSLITSDAISNNGIINVKRSMSDGQWHLISSPNNVATANVFADEYLQTWDETSATWSYITDPAATLTKVKGYSLWGIAKTNAIYTFTGTPNTGNQSIALTAGGSGNFTGANLVGNPYPSSIDWEGLRATYGAVNYWTGTQYASWNGAGTGTNGGVQYIPPMQGFFIVASTSGTFNLTNGNRTNSGATSFFKSTNKMPKNSIRLVAYDDNFTDELFIRFDEESSPDFELQNDAYKFLSSTDGLTQLYSTNTNNDMMSIDVRPACDVIQLGLINNKDGNYSIDISEMSGMSAVYLEDTKTNTFHNFADGAYNFNYMITDAETRFKLHMQVAGIAEAELDNELINIYANNNIIYVVSEYNINNGNVKIYDVTGRLVNQQSINNNKFISIPTNTKTGIYIVVVNTGASIVSKKIILK